MIGRSANKKILTSEGIAKRGKVTNKKRPVGRERCVATNGEVGKKEINRVLQSGDCGYTKSYRGKSSIEKRIREGLKWGNQENGGP